MIIKDIDQIIHEIKENCSQILQIYKKNKKFLYRGIKSTSDKIIKIKPKENRKPLDMEENIHNFLVEVFKNLHPEVNRNNSLFLTSLKWSASHYGMVYIMFPKNEFKYLWSEEIEDLFEYIDYYFENLCKENDNIIILEDKNTLNDYVFEIKEEYLQEVKKYMIDEIKEKTKITNNINKDMKIFELIKANNHILNMNNDIIKQFIKKGIFIQLNDSKKIKETTIKKFRKLYKNNDIEKALFSESEIIMKSEFFYGIKNSCTDIINLLLKE